ncbi:GPO family capsid scaffolding protein [Sphingomonas sp. PR090111-T3T-6A]|uniref:GPO family capsid scaffolding protein n=1 Tax=Sphingomonas sp. PR090111-T3T-6A TaxID=685778 RepID=UPI000369C96E|nr:GPO family capsid scaffolding protein [Sphingomonas sp. PR090111-T3T-6A]
MPKTKSFRVAVEGDTVDGRKIDRKWLTDIAATYNRVTYGARVNKEHIVGVTGTEPFKAYGDVLSVSTEEVELDLGGKKVKKLALNAEIEATDELVALVEDKQKIYTSIEVAPNFANTGKAYLVGLAVTDIPASLGTEVLSFAVKHPGLHPHMPRPKEAGNVFSLGMETSFALAEGETAPQTEAQGFFAECRAFLASLSGKKDDPAPQPAPPAPAPNPPANDNDPRFAALGNAITKMAAGIEAMGKDLKSGLGALRADHNALKAELEGTPGNFTARPAATGGKGDRVRTDC